MTQPAFTALELIAHDAVLEIRLNRPQQANALNEALWAELRSAFDWADAATTVRAVVLSGAGKHFCAGIDLAMFGRVMQQVADPDEARARDNLRRRIRDLQDCLNAAERCRKPVLAAIQGACLGGGLALACVCDMRYASADAQFAIKEIDLGMVADVGTLQRLPRLIPDGIAREMAYTGRTLGVGEARAYGLLNAVYGDAEKLLAGVLDIARSMAEKSPLAVTGSKHVLNFSRDHSIADGLDYVATWNAAQLFSLDLPPAKDC